MYFNQARFNIRCEWALEGVHQLAETSDAIIIIDIFSFTTCVDAALSRGAQVYPYRWKDESALEFARSIGGIPAFGSRKDPQGFSLSPSSLLRLPPNAKIVLPSPNGATLSLATGDCPTFAACLRNASAVAAAASALGPRVSVIPAGERWPDGSLRPAIEDLIGAGAVIHALPGKRSPEAVTAASVFLHFHDRSHFRDRSYFRDRLYETLTECASGLEAADRGTPEDVRFAAQLDVSQIAPRLVEGAYR